MMKEHNGIIIKGQFAFLTLLFIINTIEVWRSEREDRVTSLKLSNRVIHLLQVKKSEEKANRVNGEELLCFPYGEESMSINYYDQYKYKIDLNRAKGEELTVLPGIGKGTAGKIIRYREDIGRFRRISELKKVRGISTTRYEVLKRYCEVR